MSSSEDIAAAVIQPTKATRHNADGAFDAVPASESLYSSTRDPTTTTEAATSTIHGVPSHHSKKTTRNAISIDNLTDKQIEIVTKLNKHSNLLVQIFLLAAVVFMAWAMYEMGYLGNKYTPTKCI
jgi:hypothetical protein